MHLFSLIAALPLAGAIPEYPPATSAPTTTKDFRVTILADSNRDGKVDITGDTDLIGKETWTEEFGALLLANIVDTERRCSSQITGSCAENLADGIFLGPPEEPVLDPKIAKSRPAKTALWQNWFNGLSKSEQATYAEWEKKYRAYVFAADDRISTCHDSSDDILRNSTYLAPLRTMPILGLSNSATGSITITHETAASHVRLFYKTGEQWTFIASNHIFKAQDLKAGLELGIDARDIRRPGGWDGKAIVEFKVQDGEKEAKDLVALRVAPVLTQHHGQPAKQLLTASGSGGSMQRQFIKELGEISSKAGLKAPLHVFDTSRCSRREIWAQDFFEPGYMSIPGPNGPIGIHIMIRSAQISKSAGRKLFQDLRSSTVGAVQHIDDGDTTDSTGNLETIPPYTYNGKSYVAGRAIMGSAGGKKPYMMAFLEAQETQAPIELDTSWLAVKHTDEFMQFLPVRSERGWAMMVNDPRAGLEILQKAQQAGNGQAVAVSRPKSLTDERKWRVTNTIDDLLNITNFAGFQEFCASYIEKNINIIKQETGITDAEIIRIPSLFEVYKSGFWQYAEGDENKPITKKTNRSFGVIRPSGVGKQRRQIHDQVFALETKGLAEQQELHSAKDSEEGVGIEDPDAIEASIPLLHELANATAKSLKGRQENGQGNAVALYPATINSVVLGKQILAPNPWGPIIDGQDVLATAVNAAYAKAGYTVTYIDDWFTHHVKVGDVHCGSNVIRELTSVKWW